MTVDITFKIQRMGEDAPGIPIKIRLLQPNAYLPDASVPRYDYETVTDSLGEATITVDTPGTGFSWPFSCSVDNKDTCSFPLGDDNGPTITWRYIQENLCGLDPIPPSPPVYIPVVAPATTGNLVQQTADGALEDLAIAGAVVETTTGSQAKADAAQAAAQAASVAITGDTMTGDLIVGGVFTEEFNTYRAIISANDIVPGHIGFWGIRSAPTETPSAGNYSMLIDGSGNVFFNAKTGSAVSFRIANATKIEQSVNSLLLFGATYTDGTNVIVLKDVTVAPTTPATGAGILYSEGGALKWIGSGGTVTTIAPA